MIERDKELRVHKGLAIKCLREHPEDLREIFPDRFETAEEAIEALQKHSGEWFVNGVLEDAVA